MSENPYRKIKRSPRRHSGSVDGLANRRARSPVGRSSAANSIGNFKRNEGFYASKNQEISSAKPLKQTKTTEPPIEPINMTLDDESPPKKRRYRLRKPKHPLRFAAKYGGLTIIIGILVMAGFGYLKLRNIFRGGGGAIALQENVDPTKLNGEGDGRVNILILGKGGSGHEAPDLTDTLLVASIDPIAKKAALLSVPRDLYVQSGLGESKINAVYANAKYQAQAAGKKGQQTETAGLKAIESTVEETLGIPMHYYVLVDFKAFRRAINTVGGIEIDVKERLYDPTVAWENDWNPLIADVGLQQFDADRALLYARSRQSSVRGDFDRAVRQREVIVALQNKVLSKGTLSNPIKIAQLVDDFGDNVQTNLAIGEVSRLYEIIREINGSDVASIGLADPPNNFLTNDFVGGQSVVRPIEGFYVYDDIQSYVRNNLRDGFIASENAAIAVLNGGQTESSASTTAAELESYGYNVAFVGDAPEATTRRYIINVAEKDVKYTSQLLSKRLKSTVTKDKSALGSFDASAYDFVIIVQ